MGNGIVEFGFDEAKIIKSQGLETFKQNRSGEQHRLSIITFKKWHDNQLKKKQGEAGRVFSDTEKAELFAKTDEALAGKLNKSVKELTEIDRQNIKEPRFATSRTHYNEQVGTIRCLSEWEGSTMSRKELCCEKFGEPDQTAAIIIMAYPVDEHSQVERDIFYAHKMTNFYVWKLSAKKFKRIESIYVEARTANLPCIDLKVTLDGDQKYQKQLIEPCQGPAFWAREDVDPKVRDWVIDQGLRLFKYTSNVLGYEMTKDKLIEKLAAASQSTAALSSGEASAPTPRAVGSYDELLS